MQHTRCQWPLQLRKHQTVKKTEAKELLKRIEKSHKEWLESCKYFLGDKGYDSSRIIGKLEDMGIVPVIDIRNCWGYSKSFLSVRQGNCPQTSCAIRGPRPGGGYRKPHSWYTCGNIFSCLWNNSRIYV